MSATNLVATGATTTALFSTTASSTNLFSANATLGSTTLDKLAVSGNAQINGALTLTGSLSCTGQQALQTNTNGDVSCQTVNLTGITSAGGWSTNNFGTVKLATSTDAVVVGATTTLPYAKLSVAGDHTGSTTLALIPVLSQTANIIDLYNTSGVLSSVLTADHLLGLGTATPTYKLDVAGLGRFTGLVDAANFVATSTTATSTFAGSVGIGTTSPSKKFSVNGDALFSGTITSSGLIITGAITSSANSATVLPYASSTALTVSGTAYIGTASTSNLTVSNLPATLLSTNGSGVAQSTTVSAPLAFSGSTLSITQSGIATDGYLSSADYTVFNNKISSSSLSQIFPFTPTTNYGAAANSTSTALWFQNGLQASSTSRHLDRALVPKRLAGVVDQPLC
ncbi:MAG: hypothetical protein UX77_C0039G0005 [Parcubacteria group bacterium GW2011_GWA1_47_11]|nr:MAG: hypothetical protein UX77_C0039G0005 [Parcubacteria group bacterium GW2011_GWA1_47_11]